MTNVLFSMFSSLIANTPPYRKGLSSRKFLSLFLILFLAVGNAWGATDFSKLNYSGENAIPSGYTLSSKNAPNIADITSPVSSRSINISNGGASDYSAGNLPTKRFMTFVIDEGCSVVIKFTSSSTGRTLNLVPASTKTAVASVSVSSKNAEHTLSYEFSGITSATTYYLCGTSSSNLNIYSIQFTPISACTETAPTSVAVSGGATYDKGDALSNLSAAVTGGTGTMSYQWYCNTTNAATVDKEHKIDDATSATLAPYNKVGTRYYYCVVSNCAGSVTSGTTSVTINANCSATGDIFTMTMNSSNAPSSEVKTPASSTMSIDTYINIDGGDIVLVTGSSQHSSITTSPKIKLGGSSGYAKITLDCPLQEGEKITFVKTNKIALAADASGTNKIQLASGTNEYTVTKEDCLYNQSNLFVLRDGSNVEISAITITRPVYRTITLKYADGVTADGSLDALDGAPAIQPTDPTWAHHRFDGWYNDATLYDWTANVTGDLTLTARWTQLYTITYAAGDGTATGDAPTQVDKAEGETFTVAANTFEVAGKDFVKWNDGTNDYAPGATYTVGTDNIVLTAQWKAAADKYTVIFKDGTTELGTKLFDVTTNPSDTDIDKTKSLFTFAAWQKEGVDIALDDAFWATVAKDDEITLTARWTKTYATSYDMEEYAVSDGASVATLLENLTAAGYAYTNVNGIDYGHTHNYIYDGMKYKTNDGDLSFNVNAGKLVIVKTGNLPANALTMYINDVADPTVFVGANEAVETHVNNYFYSAVEALYRLDIQASKGTCAIKAVTITDPFTVSFDANGGDDVASLNGTPFVTLPLPTKGTESFKGWYDAATEGNKIGDAGDTYTPTKDIKLYAQWEAISTDIRIKALTYKIGTGEEINIYEDGKNTFDIVLPYANSYEAITVAATPRHDAATIEGTITQPTSVPGIATFTVVAQDGSTKQTYTINFAKGPKDGACIFKAELTSATAAEYSGIYADATNSKINLSNDGDKGYKFAGKSNYIQMALTGGTFAEGDILHMTYKTVPTQGELAIYNNTTKIVGTSCVNSTLEFPVGAAGLSTLYIRRTEDNNFNGWVTMVEVTRIVNPMLTTITFDGIPGVIDEAHKKVTVELPFSSDVASLEVEPTIAWNAPAATNAIVVNDGSDWVVGDNTYVLTDKDGDQTTYTITLTQAAASADATLATLTYNGTNITLVPDQYTYDIELPKGTTVVPTVTYTTNHTGATADMTDAADLPGATRIIVTAEDGATQEYVINFTVSRAISYVIYDGSLQQNIESRTGNDATGFSWSMGSNVTINGSEVPSSWNGKNYKHVIKGFKPNDNTNNITSIVIPAGYLAKITLVGTTNSEGTERSLFIATSASDNEVDAIGDYIITSSDFNAQGFTTDYLQAGMYYLGSTEACRLYELSVVLYPIDYERDVRQGYYGTICLPNKGQMIGASIFEIAYKDASKIYFDEILNGKMKAGVPYIFLPNEGADKLTVFYTDEANASAGSKNGLVGSYTQELLEANGNNYILLNNQYCEVIGEAYVGANRAYFQLSGIPTSAPALAPGARRVSMGMAGQNTATGVDQVQGDEVPTKMIINGQLFILRGEKMYDAQGKLVK